MARKKNIAFRDLNDDEFFVFERETDPFLGRSMAKGPWIKASARTYYHIDDRRFAHRVGSINVKVIRVPGQAEPPTAFGRVWSSDPALIDPNAPSQKRNDR